MPNLTQLPDGSYSMTVTYHRHSQSPHNIYVLPPPSFPSLHSNGKILSPDFISDLVPEIPEVKQPGLGLITGTVKAFLKEAKVEIPSSLKTAGVVLNAGLAGKKLANNIQEALDQGQPPTEAYLCQTAKTITEELAGKALKGMVVGGIPPYLTAATTSPHLAATVPVVLPAIPSAYQSAETAGKIAGLAAESLCHKGFDFARELAKKEK